MSPFLESFKNGKQFLIMDIVVEFSGSEGSGEESDWI